MFYFAKMNDFQKPHVVLVPFPALGHSIPFLDLASLLASHGLTVSYVTTPANVTRVQKTISEALSSNLDIHLVVLPTPVVEGLPEGRESADLVTRDSFNAIFQLANGLEEPFNSWMERQLEKEDSGGGKGAPVCIIYDFMFEWVSRIAENYKIASFRFVTCGAFAISVMHSVSCSILQNALEKEGDSVVLSLDLPRPLRLHRHEISVDFFDPDLSQPRLQFVLRRLQSIAKGEGMLINTFHELEPAYVHHLKNLTGKPVWAIGPVLPPKFFGGAAKVSERGKMADISEGELVRWLDSQRQRSIVYISFGSQSTLSEQQTNALARGLEASKQPFVWAIRVLPGTESATSDTMDLAKRFLPEGFKERTKERSLLIWGWAPQLLILSHPSVGAFMTHCGWNSTLESVTLGVPLIAWPMSGDQHFNSKLVAELGVGVQICQHRDGIPDEQKVEEVVKLVLSDKRGEEMRRSAEKLKELARNTFQDGGSSKADLAAFVSEMHKLQGMKMEGLLLISNNK